MASVSNLVNVMIPLNFNYLGNPNTLSIHSDSDGHNLSRRRATVYYVLPMFTLTTTIRLGFPTTNCIRRSITQGVR